MSPAVRRTRITLVLVGGLTLGFGAWLLFANAHPGRHPSIPIWLIGSLVAHDLVVAAVVFAASVLARRLRRRRSAPLGAILVAQGALVVAGVVTIVVAPEIAKRAIGTNNPTVLPLDYLPNLVVFDVVVLAAAAVVVAVLALRARGTGRPRPRAGGRRADR